MKTVFYILSIVAIASICAMGDQKVSKDRVVQRRIGKVEDSLADIVGVYGSYGRLVDNDIAPAIRKAVEDSHSRYLQNMPGATSPYGGILLGKLAGFTGKVLKFASMAEDYISMGDSVLRGNRTDFVDAVDSLIRKSCSALGSAIGVSLAVGAAGLVAGSSVAAAGVLGGGVLIAGSAILGFWGSKGGEWMYNDLFGVNLSEQMRKAFGTFYDILFGPPEPMSPQKKAPCNSCALGDLTGTCTTPTCPNFGHPHRDYRP